MVSLTYRMGAGYPGDYNRTAAGQTITPEAANPSFPIPAYGLPVKYVSSGSGIGPIVNGDTSAVVIGVLMREFPSQAMPPNTYGAGQSLSVPPVPPTQGPLSVMRRGFCVVNVNAGSSAAAVKGNPAYIWTAAASTGHLVGGIEATEVPGSTILFPGATFRGGVDSSGNVELEWNL
jgi:hypothetical protein